MCIRDRFKGAVLLWLAKPVNGICRMKRRVDLHVGSDQGVVPDADDIVVQKRAIHVHFTVVSKIDVVAVVGEEGAVIQRLAPFPPSRCV